MSITIKRTLGEPGGGKGRAFSRDCLIRSGTQSDAPRIATDAEGDRETDLDNPPEGAGVPLEQRNEPHGRSPIATTNQASGIDLGKGDQRDRQQRERAQSRAE